MNTLVLVFHPNISESRVNKALGATAESLGGNITVRYMYDIYPDFNIDVATEQAALLGADRIVLQYPMYWLSCPPLLKKWLDDVLTFGWAYGSTGTALHGKELLLAVSVGGAGSAYGREGAHIYTIHEFLRPMQGTSRVIGTKYAVPFLSVAPWRSPTRPSPGARRTTPRSSRPPSSRCSTSSAEALPRPPEPVGSPSARSPAGTAR